MACRLPVPKDRKEVYYYPTQKGAKWVSDWEGKERTFVITAVEDKDGAKVVSVAEVLTGGKEVPHEQVAVSDKGILRLAWGKPFDTPLWVLKVPAKAGEVAAFDIPAEPGVIPESGTKTAHGPEKVEVPAGAYLAWRVETEVTARGGVPLQPPHRSTTWFAPGVGVVKWVIGDGKSRVLKSFTPGKEGK